jgi:hypothetical protein
MVEPTKPSTFVTVLAWLGLLWAGFSIVMGVFQSIFVAVTMPNDPMSASEAAGTPAVFRFIFDHMLLFTIALASFWAVVFACALGLLRRREWGRKGFIALLLIGAIAAAGVGVLQQTLMGEMFASQDRSAELPAMFLAMRIFSAIFTLVFVTGFAWLAIRLNSLPIRAEFS